LYLSAYVYYDATASQTLSHFAGDLDLRSTAGRGGPFQVGTRGAGMVSGYFGVVPADWQAALGGTVINGNCCLPIISRTSFGPSAFAIDPLTIGASGPAPAVPLLYYPANHPLLEAGQSGEGWNLTSTLFNGTSEVRGVVFPEATASVLFFGRQGVGSFCYGPGVSDSARAGQPADGGVDRTCYDPADSSKGTHAYPYVYYVWAYDANDLAAVKAGRTQPWDVRPYATWPLDLPFAINNAHLNGAAYDPETGRIFVAQAFGDGDRPLIHVLRVRKP
jgi:hypothetical protein